MYKLGLSLLLVLALTACGFTPLYATKGSGILPSEDKEVIGETSKIYVEPIANRLGQIMRQNLIAQFSPRVTSEEEYSLTVVNRQTLYSEQGISKDSVPSRITIGYTADYTLKKGDEVLLNDTAFAQSSYNILQSGYSTVTTKAAVERQIILQLSQNIALRVTAFLKKRLLNDEQ